MPEQHVGVEGIVARRNGEPYLRLSIEGMTAQLSMAEARNIARDIEKMYARTECDAMVYKFFDTLEAPPEVAAAAVISFRGFRSKLDAEEVEKTESAPSGDWHSNKTASPDVGGQSGDVA
jgi:hypothetical protein